MNLRDIPDGVRVYGNADWRGKCAAESMEQMTFFSWLRRQHPKLGMIALHPRNEGQRTIQQAQRHKAEGMTTGASDVIIPGAPAFVCEMKRKDHTQSKWQDGQKEYLQAAHEAGAFVCVAFGWEAAKEALEEWLTVRARN